MPEWGVVRRADESLEEVPVRRLLNAEADGGRISTFL